MAADLILTASRIITMETDAPTAQAVAIDTGQGTIVAVGSLADCQAAAPGVAPTDLGDSVLMPGFIDPHSHPILAGVMTQSPAFWIAPYLGYPTYADVQAFWRKLDAKTPPGQALVFTGLDRILQGAPELTKTDLDTLFPSRPVAVLDNSGHEVYFNSAVITLNGWVDGKPPADPVGSHFGRNPDGTSNGRAVETGAELAAIDTVLKLVGTNPLLATARWYNYMAQYGITTTSDHAYKTSLLKAYEALASVPDVPLRVAVYHMSTEPDAGDPLQSETPTDRVWKVGIKLWADGSPWVGTMAASFPYVDTPVVRTAQIPLGPGGEDQMNYTRLQLDAVLDRFGHQGWQLAFHVNGDIGIDIVLDSYACTLAKFDLLGTDHRWRIEHVGAGRRDQFDRAAALGVSVSMSPFQFIYWGDLLDGQLFDPAIGSQWISAGDCFASGAVTTFNNDGPVSPPIPLLNIQCMVTRRTPSGQVHGINQSVSIEDAFRAHTINAAHQLGREDDLGSLKVGKLADFVELSMDPFTADIDQLADQVKVLATWSGGRKTDADAFQRQIEAIDPTEHQHLATEPVTRTCC